MNELTKEQIKRQKALAWLKRVAYENPCMKEVKTCIEVLSAPTQPVIPEQCEVSKKPLEVADKLQDSEFRHGLKQGFSFGQTDDQDGFEKCLSAYAPRGKDNG